MNAVVVAIAPHAHPVHRERPTLSASDLRAPVDAGALPARRAVALSMETACAA